MISVEVKTYIQTPSWRYNNQLELEEEEILMDLIYKINQLKDHHIFLNGVLLFDNWNPNSQTDGDVFPGLYFEFRDTMYLYVGKFKGLFRGHTLLFSGTEILSDKVIVLGSRITPYVMKCKTD